MGATKMASTETSDASSDDRTQALAAASKAIRGRKTRVKTGCVTCRIRRIKCDEKRPSCERCTSTGRKCDGYPSLPMSRKDLPVAVHDRKSLLLSSCQVRGVGGFDDETEMLYFDFFRNKTTPGTNRYLGSDFWRKLVLQLSHSEPAIKHAVLAISALHQQWDMYKTSGSVMDAGAMAQYSKGVAAAQTMLQRTKPGKDAQKEDIEKVLVACVLFVCFENLIGDYVRAARHLAHGLQILDDEGMQLSARGVHAKLETNIVELLNRFDFQAITFSQEQVPLRKAVDRFKHFPPTPLPSRFESLAEIRSVIFEYMSWTLTVVEVFAMSRDGNEQDPTQSPQMFIEANRERDRVEATLSNLWSLVEEYVGRACLPAEPSYRSSCSYAYLRVYHRVAAMIITAGCTAYETSWDAYLTEFQENLNYLDILQSASAEQDMSLSLEVGICVPLFIIGNKCRDPVTRRRAVAILDRGKRKEGIWESEGAARVLERLIIVEERVARQLHANATGRRPEDIAITCAADIPEEARSQTYHTDVNMAEHIVKMEITLRSGTLDNPVYTTVREKVEF